MNTFPAVRCIAPRHARLSRFKRLAFASTASIVLLLPLTGATLLPATRVDSVMVIDGIPGDSKLLPDAIHMASDLEGGKESVSLKFGKITESALGEFAPATFVLFTI